MTEGGAPARGRLLTIRQVAEEWQVTPRTIRRMIERRALRAMRVGRQLRIRIDVIERFEARNRTDTAS